MKEQLARRNCLLIAPNSFYSYSQYLKAAISAQGYDVTICNDEYPANNLGKIMGKLRIPALKTITSKVITRDYIEGKSYNLVIIIKGRGLSTGLINHLRQVSGRVVGYTYDCFRFHPAPLDWYKELDNFYTFDYRDAEKHGIPVVELFSSFRDEPGPKKITHELSAIVRNHSDRLSYIDKVVSALAPETVFIYIFEKSFFTFLQNFLTSPRLYLKYRRHIHFKSLSYQAYCSALKNSEFTIDFGLPVQTGTSIRCFEALSVQTKVITSNDFIYRHPGFTGDNALVFNYTDSTAELKKSYSAMKGKLPLKHNRSIADFVNDLTA
jgi:hypothetical protein